MLWPLYVNRTIVIRKRMRASVEAVSEIISNGELYMELQPFVIKMEQDHSKPRSYMFIERVPSPLGCGKLLNAYEVTFSPPVEAADGQGVNMWGRMIFTFVSPKFRSSLRVKETEEAGVVEVVEILVIEIMRVMTSLMTRMRNQPRLDQTLSLGLGWFLSLSLSSLCPNSTKSTMLWPLYIDRTIVIRRRIRASLAAVAEFTSDGEKYMRLQPFVMKMQEDTSNPCLYRVLERVPAPFGLWEMDNSFELVFSQPVEDEGGRGIDMSGQMDAKIVAPKVKSTVRVRETEEPGVVEVVEILSIQVLIFMASYVAGLIERAHKDLLSRLAERVEANASS
ncbi:hypothetical protein NP233_g10586 [Leucocoprinus birnbaumii]|uniref:Uncharacterized protein n=1 Tax=Leucocoprinus birnbaumii TaxID=56174 RepID=A0AAD5YRQ7_9AGAR|nr:hypothetical protein NP233_g10586 [Leucocoprinus birnbaumii]